MRKLILITTVFVLSASQVFAQSDSDSQVSSGSVYSQMGVGFPVDIANTSASSSGLLGVSFNQSNVATLANPAHWGSTFYGLGSGGLELQSFSASKNGESVSNTNLSAHQFQLQLPAIRGKLGISASFSPVTRSDYQTIRFGSEIIQKGSTQDTLAYRVENLGSGGVNRAELGIGWQINKNVSVGYAASAMFISNENKFSALFGDPSYQAVNYRYETSGVGLGNRFGVAVRLPGTFQEGDQLGLGATIDLPVNINGEKKKKSGEIRQPMDPIKLGEGTIRIPLKMSGGISYYPNNKLMFGLEGLYHQWSDYKNELSAGTLTDVSFVDQYKLGLGMKYFPYATGSDKFLSQFKYGFGLSYDSGHLRINDERINTLKFSLGLGIRAPKSNSSIDISLEYGIRGTDSMSLVKEQVWGVKLSLNLAEIMFFRPKLQ